jgi:hypothetical protein
MVEPLVPDDAIQGGTGRRNHLACLSRLAVRVTRSRPGKNCSRWGARSPRTDIRRGPDLGLKDEKIPVQIGLILVRRVTAPLGAMVNPTWGSSRRKLAPFDCGAAGVRSSERGTDATAMEITALFLPIVSFTWRSFIGPNLI